MNRSTSLRRFLVVLFSVVVLACSLVTLADAQSAPPFPAPDNPLSLPGTSMGSDAIPVSSGMLAPFLPKIPNLEFGFLYSFGKNVRTGRFTADYTIPFDLSSDSVLFAEAHAEGWEFWKRFPGTANNRIDLSVGGGYRTILGGNTFLGVNGFYDTSRLYNRWYSSGGVGLEMASIMGGDDAVDLNFNWYGNLFNKDVLVNAFRNRGGSFDVEAGYSHALFDHYLDLRLKFAGYQFDVGNAVYGWRGGADLTTRNGMFTLRYEHGHDRIDGNYNTVGGFVNVGFQLENVLKGESPFMNPEPIFKSPRNLRYMLTQTVKRNWHQAAAIVATRTATSGPCPEGQYRLLTDSLDSQHVYTTAPPTPTNPSELVSKTVRVRWCKLKNPQTSPVWFRFVYDSDASNLYFVSILFGGNGPKLDAVDGERTYVLWSAPSQAPYSMNIHPCVQFMAQDPTAKTYVFDQGGGITVSLE